MVPASGPVGPKLTAARPAFWLSNKVNGIGWHVPEYSTGVCGTDAHTDTSVPGVPATAVSPKDPPMKRSF